MSRVVIHIGIHKTGSTYLQEAFFPHMDVDLVTDIGESHLRDLSTGGIEAVAEAARTSRMRGRGFVWSQEALSGRADGNRSVDYKAVAQCLGKSFSEVTILIVLRRPRDYILSLFCYYAVNRGLVWRDLGSYLDRNFQDRLAPKLDYRDLVSLYRGLFDPNQVVVLRYEDFRDHPECFLSEVSSLCGCEMPRPLRLEKVNQSFRSARVVALHRAINLPVITTCYVLERFGSAAHAYKVKRWFREFKPRKLMPLTRWLDDERGKGLEIPQRWEKQIAALDEIYETEIAFSEPGLSNYSCDGDA